MFTKYSNRREFFKFLSLSFILLLNSCRNGNISKKLKIALQISFYPDAFKDLIPNSLEKENIDLENIYPEKNTNKILESEFTLINDGWINKINFQEFKKINETSLFENLDKRSRDYLNSFEVNKRSKLLPIGVVPYAVIIKNNKDLIKPASQSWDFLFSKQLNKKIIFPSSPRIMFSIAKKINIPNALTKLKNQAKLFDDKNSINWLINSEASVAIIPYNFCLKYLKYDPRLSIVFPDQGVPLIWYFVITRTNNIETLVSWIKLFEIEANVQKLAKQGWYLPFENNYTSGTYKPEIFSLEGPSENCWYNSWSLPLLTKLQKINLENSWNQSLIP